MNNIYCKSTEDERVSGLQVESKLPRIRRMSDAALSQPSTVTRSTLRHVKMFWYFIKARATDMFTFGLGSVLLI